MNLRKEYRRERVFTPISRFVHKRLNSGVVRERLETDPPMPPKEPGRGWPVWILAHRGRELVFASPEEMAHVADMLGQKVLPRPWQIYEGIGRANSHWLSKLHASWTPWRVRERLVKELRAANEAQRGA